MSKPRRRILFAALAVALAVGFFLASRRLHQPVARLANGTQLALLTVTHGPSNILYPGGKLDELIHRIAGSKGIQFGPLKIKPDPPLSDNWSQAYGSPSNIVIWIGHQGPPNTALLPIPENDWFKEVRATLTNEAGEEWETRPPLWGWPTPDVRGLNGITAWSFPAFPRRGKTLHFRLYARNKSEAWDTLADFSVANPMPGPYPVWVPSRLPATRTNGNLVVSLVELVSGKKTMPYYPGERAFTKVLFEVKESDQVTSSWLPDRMEATDATGNKPWIPMVNYYPTNNHVLYEMQVINLSPTEVWKLKTRFVNAQDQTAVWTSPQIEVVNGTVLPFNLKTNWQDGMLTFQTSDYPFPGNLRLDLFPLPTNAVLRLVEFVDDRGRPVTYQAGGFSDSGFDAKWQVPAGANWIAVKVRLAETRQVEFLAQPIRQ